MFGSYWANASANITYLICHVTLHDHVIEGSCDVMGRSPLMVSYHAAKFGSHKHCGTGDIFNLSRDLTRPRNYRTM